MVRANLKASRGKHIVNKRTKALLALVLLVPIPSLGTYLGMVGLAGQGLGQALFLASKVWILLLPLVWQLVVKREALSWSKPHGGFLTGGLLGAGISLVILACYHFLGSRLLEPAQFQKMAANVGLGEVRIYLAAAAYWILANSVLEEYVWRWFVVENCRALLPAGAAIAASALGFTLHHILALHVYCAWPVVVLGASGVFIGGALWSWCYLRYRSVWPGYLSHAIVDVAIFAIGYDLIFRSAS
jgi:membrane protease YdiL (CAAX protease family)